MKQIETLNQEIIKHVKARPKLHPGQCPKVRKLATFPVAREISRDPNKVIEVRMRHLKKQGVLTYQRKGARYVIIELDYQLELFPEPPNKKENHKNEETL